ncbi:MAG TPA: hypothetical protein VLM76_09310 [Patescibacteria group bacterium]|nr:hypothetical protein [Patescibacteria group bacterium]
MPEPATLQYAGLLIAVGLLTTALLARHLWAVTRAYRIWHDERAAFAVVLAVGLLVISGALLVAAFGLLIDNYEFHLAGLSAARGAFFTMALTLVSAGRSMSERP